MSKQARAAALLRQAQELTTQALALLDEEKPRAGNRESTRDRLARVKVSEIDVARARHEMRRLGLETVK